MVSINLSREVTASLDRVWGVISDVDNEPLYWQDLHSVRNLQRNGDIIERVATVGFRNSRSSQTVILTPKKSVKVVITKGPMIGTRVTTISSSPNGTTSVNVGWDMKLDGIPFFVRGSVEKRLAKATEEALNRIAEAAA